MIDYNKFMEGTSKFIEDEILNQIKGYQKWIAGTMVGIAAKRGENIFDDLANNYLVQALEIIDENDMIDDDIVYEELKKQAKGNPITIELPMVGKIKLDESDVENWHRYMHS